MSYSTRAEVRGRLKDGGINSIIGDEYQDQPARWEELAGSLIDEAIADGEIDGYLIRH